MLICSHCNQEISGDNPADDCTENRIIEYEDRVRLSASIFHFNELSGRCHDCNIKHGNYHHPGCSVERCPRCGGQIISCGCSITNQIKQMGEIMRVAGKSTIKVNNPTPIGEMLRIYRVNHVIGQSELAKKIGVSPSTISRWEAEQNEPLDFDDANKLIRFLFGKK